ncbi:MAG TPA: STAS domain-containing protein [Kiritimatiellia bacterium]|nr:STAS domain-containing protein [Kiritimatiellia bacterium]HMP00099.1 STAS domain-containing protein [Kiritimatiellia bacterium]HMP96640.1 STAS domain-containing protein [Kiritimatiellia bacterium]
MSDPASPPVDQAFVVLSDRHALIRVEGRGSFKISASLKQFGDAVVRKKVSLILVDMTRCIGMDSTFMGVLAGMASRLKPIGGNVALVNCSPRTRGLLATLGLDQLIEASEVGATPEAYASLLEGRAPREKLEAASCQDPDTVKTMLDAHQNLVDLVPENLPQFKDVLLFLREEMNRKAGDRQGAE